MCERGTFLRILRSGNWGISWLSVDDHCHNNSTYTTYTNSNNSTYTNDHRSYDQRVAVADSHQERPKKK